MSTQTTIDTPLGELTLVAEAGALCGVYFPGHWTRPDRSTFGRRSERGLQEVERQFADRMRNVTMVGTFTVSGRESRTPRTDRYDIVSVEKIGRVLGVSQSTASRWLAKARESVLRDLKSFLKARLEISSVEIESLAGLLASRLDLSISRVLEVTSAPAPERS